ncbi:hypothetical protein ACT8ZV_03370 [Nocardioides sp. MAHUQ-72]|uniref:hypothetical protein n=1 Tax=unclassified Nocardioides TaxID=2615069 RepID=UPI003613A4FB
MRLAPVLLALLLTAACGTDTGDDGGTATDPGSSARTGPASGSPSSAGVPAADRPVTTRRVATVMDTGRPELCLGPVAESYPPQCRGIPLAGWDWSRHPGSYETAGDVRWGGYVVTGTFDGTTLTVTRAVPEDDQQPTATDELSPTGDAGSFTPGQQQLVQEKLAAHPVPGTLTVFATPMAVVVEVVHDDGSLQAAADSAYGAGVVQVRSMLVPVS